MSIFLSFATKAILPCNNWTYHLYTYWARVVLPSKIYTVCCKCYSCILYAPQETSGLILETSKTDNLMHQLCFAVLQSFTQESLLGYSYFPNRKILFCITIKLEIKQCFNSLVGHLDLFLNNMFNWLTKHFLFCSSMLLWDIAVNISSFVILEKETCIPVYWPNVLTIGPFSFISLRN